MVGDRRGGPALCRLGIAGLLALGCVQVKEHLTIRADGSGSVTIDVKTEADPEMLAMMKRAGGRTPAISARRLPL